MQPYKHVPSTWPFQNGILKIVSCDVSLMSSGYIETLVPNDPENSDWRAYQEWLNQGNTPDPADS